MKEKIKSLIVLSLSVLVSASCSVDTRARNDTFITNFQNIETWRIEGETGFVLSEVLLGFFEGDLTVSLPDLLVTGNTGAEVFPNLIKVRSTGWGAGQSLQTLAGVDIRAMITVDDPSSDLNALIVATGTNQLLLYRPNSGAYNLSSTFNLSTSDPLELVANSTGSLILVGGGDGVHQFVSLNQNFVLIANSITPGSSAGAVVEVFSADLNADSVDDFLIVGENGVQTLEGRAGGNFDVGSATLAADSSRQIESARIADVDGDNDADLLLSTSTGFEYFRNITDVSSAIQFDERTISLIPEVDDVLEFELVDFTEDLIVDLLVLSESQGPLFYSGSGQEAFSDLTARVFAGVELNAPFGEGSSAAAVQDMVVGDLDGDLVPDLIFASQAGDIAVFFNLAEDGADAD